jgi:hypothetical protein
MRFNPLDTPEKVAALSHYIRIKHENNIRDEKGGVIILDLELIKSIIKNLPPSPAEQADNVVRWLSRKAPGEVIQIDTESQISIIGSATFHEVEIVLDYLKRAGFIKGEFESSIDDLTGWITLTVEGWQYNEKLKRGATDIRKAFMAMKYGDEQLDKIVEEVFKPAAKQTDFDLVRFDDNPKAGLIDDQLRIEIQTSRFLIADLTHNNLGAYWEAGYAEGLGKPVIYTCEKTKLENPDTKPHFDTNHHLTIPWDTDNLQEAANQLKATIRATFPEQAKLNDD